jgi:serine/threonine-protein kinase RsbT
LVNEICIPINSDNDIVKARQNCRALATTLGFSNTDQTLIATAISELARNVVEYAQHGEIVMFPIQEDGKSGICVIVSDDGPGIMDVAQAMQDGYSSRRSLGLGLPGTKRIVDEFEINSTVGSGTTIKIKKWDR